MGKGIFLSSIMGKKYLKRNIFFLSLFPKRQPWVITLSARQSFTQRISTQGSSSSVQQDLLLERTYTKVKRGHRKNSTVYHITE